jgi:hypothetical protein
VNSFLTPGTPIFVLSKRRRKVGSAQSVRSSNHRLIALNDDKVYFRWRDSAHGNNKEADESAGFLQVAVSKAPLTASLSKYISVSRGALQIQPKDFPVLISRFPMARFYRSLCFLEPIGDSKTLSWISSPSSHEWHAISSSSCSA